MPPVIASRSSPSEIVYADIRPDAASLASTSPHGDRPAPETYRPGAKELNYGEIEHLKSPNARRRFTPAPRTDKAGPAAPEDDIYAVPKQVDNRQRKKTPPPVAPREGPSARKDPQIPLRLHALTDGPAREQLDDVVKSLVGGFATSTPRGFNPLKQKAAYGATAASNALVKDLLGDDFGRAMSQLDAALGQASNRQETKLKQTCVNTAVAHSVNTACAALSDSQKEALQRHLKSDLVTRAVNEAQQEMTHDWPVAGDARMAFLEALTLAARRSPRIER